MTSNTRKTDIYRTTEAEIAYEVMEHLRHMQKRRAVPGTKNSEKDFRVWESAEREIKRLNKVREQGKFGGKRAERAPGIPEGAVKLAMDVGAFGAKKRVVRKVVKSPARKVAARCR